MRTTLKRAYGRGTAGADGDGRPALPPDALSPITFYRQPEPPRRGRWRLLGRILLWACVVLVMLAAAFVGGVYLWLHESVAAVRAHSKDVVLSEKHLDVPLPGRAAIALLLGYDRRADEASSSPSRSDTLMLVRADPATKSISMLSFPRDMLVQIRCSGRSPFLGKINSAYAQCGSRGSLETVKGLTDLPVNYLITVNFRGFKKVVNTLGGVWVDVDRRYFNDNKGVSPGYGYATINLRPGYQRLTGGSALDFVRYRHTDSDLYRVARQQLFVQAMKEQFRTSFSLTKIPKLVGAITHNVEVGVGGGKELSGKTILSYARFAYELPAGHFFQAKINGLTGYSDLTTDASNIQEAVHEFVTPDVEAPKVATAVALGRKIRTAAPKPAQTTITVLNGNGVPGSAGNAKYLLGQRGYDVVEPPSGATGNAPSFGYFHTKIYFRPRARRAKAAAQALSKLFGAADVEATPRVIRPLSNGAMLTVVVGSTFHNSLAPPPPARELKREPPYVTYDRAGAESLLRGVKKRVPFKLMVPTVIERSSISDPEAPIRAYAIEGRHKAVRLVFRTGGRQYWGVEETDWEDAPVLENRNFRNVLEGRVYDFYYHGPHLHMIVLRENGATYWVVNTLLDSLSNETMIAVAKGLKPLDQPKKPKRNPHRKAKKPQRK